jgi:hypothetical protein
MFWFRWNRLFDGRDDYGAVGSVMNLASRLCDQAAMREILVSERVRAEIESVAETVPAGEFTLKGFPKPILGFRLEGLAGDPIDVDETVLRSGNARTPAGGQGFEPWSELPR